MERPKRYSNMRSNIRNLNEQQTLGTKMQHYQVQRSNNTIEPSIYINAFDFHYYKFIDMI